MPKPVDTYTEILGAQYYLNIHYRLSWPDLPTPPTRVQVLVVYEIAYLSNTADVQTTRALRQT